MPRQRTIPEIVAILEAKRAELLANIDAAGKGPRGGGRPRGFQAEGQDRPEITPRDLETTLRGRAWLTWPSQIDADFLLPVLGSWYQDLLLLGIQLPPWTREPQDDTQALSLLSLMIAAAEDDVPEYVNLDQAAAAVNRSKKTLENRKSRKENPLPDPDIDGGGGKPDEWKWSTIRPWLEAEFGRPLPKKFPRLR